MARGGFFAALQRASRAAQRDAERAHRAAYRDHQQSVRHAEQAQRATQVADARLSRSLVADRKQAEKQAREAHLAYREAEVRARNSALEQVYDEVDSLLASTLAVDDYVDLEALRTSAKHPAFDRSDLEAPIPLPQRFIPPPKPILNLPAPPSGLRKLFGTKGHERALELARTTHDSAVANWEAACQIGTAQHVEDVQQHSQAESARLKALAAEQDRYTTQCRGREHDAKEQNRQLDELITNLGYGVPKAIQEYVSIVLANSAYPDHFKVSHEFTFETESAELQLSVRIPPPNSTPSIKGYKCAKTSDEIVEVALSQREVKDRYTSAVHQVALRSFHEVFESDRRGQIKTVSLEVGTETIDPATGRQSYILFVIAAAERDRFLALDLSAVVPQATLAHLGAAISKNPFGLVSVGRSGVRRT